MPFYYYAKRPVDKLLTKDGLHRNMRSHFSGFRLNFNLFRLCSKQILISDMLTESIYIYTYILCCLTWNIVESGIKHHKPTNQTVVREKVSNVKIRQCYTPGIKGMFFPPFTCLTNFVKGFDSIFLVSKCVFPIKTDVLHHKQSPSSQQLFFSIIFIPFIWSMVIDMNRFTM